MKIAIDCTNQYMMKSRDRDMPRMLPFQKFTVTVDIDGINTELAPYLPIYLENQEIMARSFETEMEPEFKPYNAPRDLAKKWRAKVRKATRQHNSDVKDLYKLTDDEAIEQGIVLSVDFAIDDYLTDQRKDELLAKAGLEKPADTADEYLYTNIFHVVSWKPVIEETA